LNGAEFWTFGRSIRNTWKVIKCDAEKGGKGSVGPTVWEMKKCYRESRQTGVAYIQYKEGRLHGLVIYKA
jgi:hypothetical protein